MEQALAGTLLQGLEIEPIRNSRLVRINFDSPDPALAAKVANAYARVFIDSGRQRRLEASASASKYLSERLVQLQQKVEESEARLVAYSGQERIVSVGDDKPSLPAQNLAELNALLASAQEAGSGPRPPGGRRARATARASRKWWPIRWSSNCASSRSGCRPNTGRSWRRSSPATRRCSA